MRRADEGGKDALAGDRRRPAIEREHKSFARDLGSYEWNFGSLFLGSGQYEGESNRDTRVSDQTKSAVRMRIGGEAVCMNDLYDSNESNQH
jgi:hypothetical protein